ncbi:MAG: rhodanese-like domain-containing protein [Chitinophagales bacterium]
MQIITVEELKARLDRGEPVRLLDVREPSENTEFNIGGTLLPLGRVQMMMVDEIESWKEEEVICYCRSGNRSGQACQILDMLGFKHTYNLAGGMLAWKERIGSSGK